MRKNTKKLSTLGLALALLLSIFTTSAYAVSLPTSEVTSEPVTGETSQLDDSIIAEATTEDATDTTITSIRTKAKRPDCIVWISVAAGENE